MPKQADPDQVLADFHQLVNMDAGEISAWLKTKDSKSVGFVRPGETESVGRQSARRIIKILGKDEAALGADDFAHMRKVIGFIRRHRGQGPHDEFRVPFSRWRYSLMNWGHDPLKDSDLSVTAL